MDIFSAIQTHVFLLSLLSSGHVFLPTSRSSSSCLVHLSYWVFFASTEESGRAASDNGGDTVALADDSAVQESELAVDGAGLAALPSCAHI